MAHYQPILTLEPEALTLFGFEALIRGPHSLYQESVDLLYDEVVEVHDRRELDQLCTAQVIREAVELPCTGVISINAHLDSLSVFPDFPHGFLRAAHEAGLPPGRLLLEVDAQGARRDGSYLESIRHLRQAGVRIALDEFGHGDANLELFLEIRPDFLKYSGFLVQGLMEDPWRQELLKSTLVLAEKTRTALIVKGLETPGDFRMARWLGAKLFQGFLFAVPGPLEFWKEAPFPSEWPLQSFMRVTPQGGMLGE